jgi:hypothetical protein
MAQELKGVTVSGIVGQALRLPSELAGGAPALQNNGRSTESAAEDSGSYTREPVLGSNGKRGETPAHAGLKRLALIWAQARGYSACAVEVQLPRCRFRADVAAYRPNGKEIGTTAIFECKQAFPDLRRDNGCSAVTEKQLEKVFRRRQVLEKNLRVHYPALRIADSLFADFDSYNFAAIHHRGYTSVLRRLSALQNRLFDCTKFERLVRYRCANLFFLVLPNGLFREAEVPFGWGALVESDGELVLTRKPLWHEVTAVNRLKLLERIAGARTRVLNKELEITFERVSAARSRSCP